MYTLQCPKRIHRGIDASLPPMGNKMSDRIQTVDGQSLHERERRRRAMIVRSVPYGLAFFAICAATGEAAFVSKRMWTPPAQARVVLREAAGKCPYLIDRIERGLPVECSIGPDHAELNAARGSFKV